jgi:hypothetical protein
MGRLSPAASTASSDASSAGETVLVIPTARPGHKRADEALPFSPRPPRAAAADAPAEPAERPEAAPVPAPAPVPARAALPRLHLSHEHPAVLAALSGATISSGRLELRGRRSWVHNYVLMPLALPLLGVLFLAALVAAFVPALMVWPAQLLARRLYWACPFLPHAWQVMISQRLSRPAAQQQRCLSACAVLGSCVHPARPPPEQLQQCGSTALCC